MSLGLNEKSRFPRTESQPHHLRGKYRKRSPQWRLNKTIICVVENWERQIWVGECLRGKVSSARYFRDIEREKN